MKISGSAPYRSKYHATIAGRPLSLVRERAVSRSATTRLEQFLLMMIIVLLPLQDCPVCNAYSPLPNFPIMFALFAISGAYVMLTRSGMLAKTWEHPVFQAAYAFLALIVLLESGHPDASYGEIFRIAQMVAGAVIIATLCRDESALRAVMYGYIIAAVWLAVFLFSSSYSTLSVATVTDFSGATLLREEMFSDSAIRANLNGMAFIAGQGAVVALALALGAAIPLRRYLLLGVSLFCFIAAFLPLSRSGAAIVVVSCAAVLYVSRAKFGRGLLAACVLAAAIMMLVPDAVWTRMTFSTEIQEGKQEGRAQVYTAFLEGLPQYGLTGIGVGHFFESWGWDNGFAKPLGVIGAHNCFFQVMINWGIIGLLALTAVVWNAYRYLPRQRHNAMVAAIFGITVSLIVLMQVIHNLYAKEFSLGLGLIVGANRWIWPKARITRTLNA